ncbi:MAG: right-handed parallel beta-helix repeat-containing protein [Actinobacteria bacterium]|nr:right-handed parallel beta-helix repeat-containing protein [Actinomycetota bacterium]
MKALVNCVSATLKYLFSAVLMMGGVFFWGFGSMPAGSAETEEKLYVLDDSTGGNCTQIGIWNEPLKTCTLTTDLNDVEIYIDSNYITLDGNGHTLTLNKFFVSTSNDAVTITRVTGVTVKNFIFQNYHYGVNLLYANNNIVTDNVVINVEGAGISLTGAHNNVLTNNNIRNNGADTGFCIGYTSTHNYIAGNTVTDFQRGIYIHDFGDGNTITGNTLTNNRNAITLYDSDSYNVITDNEISTDKVLPDPIPPIIPTIDAAIYLHGQSHHNSISGNTISGTNNGIYFDGAGTNEVYQNNFMGIAEFQISASGGMNNVFNLPSGGGGNYWREYDEPSEGCIDLNIDGFCDSAFAFPGGQDSHPFTSQNSWDCASPSLSLSLTSVYWENLADYQNRELSLDWQITNTGGTLAKNVNLVANYHGAGVMTTTQFPYGVGNIAASNGSKIATTKALVPMDVSSFRSWVYAKSQDSCDIQYYYPGLPPEV